MRSTQSHRLRRCIGMLGLIVFAILFAVSLLPLLVPPLPVSVMFWTPIKFLWLNFLLSSNGMWYYLGDVLAIGVCFLTLGSMPQLVPADQTQA